MCKTVGIYEFDDELRRCNKELKEFANRINPKFAQVFGGIEIRSTRHDFDSDGIENVAVSCCSFGKLTAKEAVELSTILEVAASIAMSFKYNGFEVVLEKEN